MPAGGSRRATPQACPEGAPCGVEDDVKALPRLMQCSFFWVPCSGSSEANGYPKEVVWYEPTGRGRRV